MSQVTEQLLHYYRKHPNGHQLIEYTLYLTIKLPSLVFLKTAEYLNCRVFDTNESAPWEIACFTHKLTPGGFRAGISQNVFTLITNKLFNLGNNAPSYP